MSEVSEQQTEALEAAVAFYEPAPETNQLLGHTVLVTVMGPILAGKTTITRAAASLDSEFGCVTSLTTRPRRPGEDEDAYDFREHTNTGVANILRELAMGELVECHLHPANGRIYGTTVDEYRHPYSLLDTVPSALSQLARLPFGDRKMIALTTSRAEWYARYEASGPTRYETDSQGRIAEGVSNLEWCLGQGNDIVWLNNSGRGPEDTAEELVAIVKGTRDGDICAREIGRELLVGLQEFNIQKSANL